MLELLGAAFLVIVVCMLIGGMAGVVWMRGQVREASVVGALRESLNDVRPATLDVAAPGEWHHVAEAELLCGEFLDSGLRPIGYYSIPEIDDIYLRAFLQENPPAYLCVNDHPKYGCWTDIVMLPKGGGSVTLTTVAAGSNSVPRPARHEIEKLHVSTHPKSMLGYVRSRLLDGEFKPVSAEAFLDVFNGIMKDCQNALADQDIEQSWLESVASETGLVLSGDEAETINAERQLERHEHITKQCLQRYAKDLGLSAEQWEEQRSELLVVYENIPDWLLVEQLYERLPVPEELEADLADIEHDGKPARVSARQFISMLPESDLVEHLATLTDPLVADIYKVPDIMEELRDAA